MPGQFGEGVPPPVKEQEQVGDKITRITDSISRIKNASSKTQKERLLNEITDKLGGDEFSDVSDFFLGTDKIQGALVELVKDSLINNTFSAGILKKVTELRGFNKDFFIQDSSLKDLLEQEVTLKLDYLEVRDSLAFIKIVIEKGLLPKEVIKKLVLKQYVHVYVNHTLAEDKNFTDTDIKTILNLDLLSQEDIQGAMANEYLEFLKSFGPNNKMDENNKKLDKKFQALFPATVVQEIKQQAKQKTPSSEVE